MNAPCQTSTADALLPELTQRLHRFFHELDQRRYEEMLAMFTEDCRWLRQGQWLVGRQAVRDALRARSMQIDTLHVMSNAFVSEASDDAATLEAYMTAYRYPAQDAADGGLPKASGPYRLNVVTTAFSRGPVRDWLIAEQRMVAALAFE